MTTAQPTSKMPDRRVLLLDIDGVVIRGRPEDGAPWKQDLEADLGIPPSALREHFFAPFWADIVRGRRNLLPNLRDALSRLRTDVSAEALVDYWFRNDARIDTRLLEDLSQFRKAGLTVWFATNQDHLRAAYLMETLRLRAFADGMFHSAAIGACKPEPAFYEHVAGELGHPEHLCLIDDSVENVDAARSAGWAAELWTGTQNLADVLRKAGWPQLTASTA